MDNRFKASGGNIAVRCKGKSSIYTQFMLACLLVHLPRATAHPGSIRSPPALNETLNNNTTPTFEASIHEDNPLTTITFGVFSTVIAFGSLVIGVMQYRRWKKRHSSRPVANDEEMHEISQHHTHSQDTVVVEAHGAVTPPLRVLTSPLTHPSPSSSRTSTSATQLTLVEPSTRKDTTAINSSIAEDASSKEVGPSLSTQPAHHTEHFGYSGTTKPFDN